MMKHSSSKPSTEAAGFLATSIEVTTSSLRMIPARASGPLGTLTTYELLDSGLHSTLIDKDLVKRLGLIDEPAFLSVPTAVQAAEVQAVDRLSLVLLRRANDGLLYVIVFGLTSAIQFEGSIWELDELCTTRVVNIFTVGNVSEFI
ncbi:hypothetical protein FGIG_07523 [Fasciola gigantica]|uniref:Uncharacterized protein n=1 Tax=Fasciola gigantica TaxID=46835 RepID=A0A504Y4L9_FASGI|nr:hypothetical protein FGIG_07523 [Fasciola gigantica]